VEQSSACRTNHRFPSWSSCWVRRAGAAPASTPQTLSRKDAALFALVALGASPPRERVAAWLWPEVPAKTAQVNLRQRLFKLRQLSGHPLIDSGATLSLAAGVKVDAAATEPADEGDLLGGFDYGDLEALDGWVVAERERLARVRLEQQLARAAKLESEGALAGAIELCERIVAKAPWHEHAWRRLMRAHYQRGDRAAAIDAFERCERFVRGEQGSRPSAETLALLATIERLEAPAPAVRWLPDCLQHPPVMVGRDGLLERLQAAWSAGRSVLLLGEGGIGKSRLLAEFLRWHEGVQQRRARPGEAASAYATAVLLLREVMERWQPALEEATRAELARLLPGLGTPPQGDGQQALLWQACEQLLLAAHAAG
jgi:DNA-binding SARP family transcriptional activator